MDSFDPDKEIDKIVTFIRSVFEQSGAENIVLGVSGGVDSAVCLHLCAMAVGPDKVIGIHMPSRKTPETDIDLAVNEIRAVIGTPAYEPIWSLMDSFSSISVHQTRMVSGNLSARVRMCVLYLYANHYNGIVCGTGNFTEYYLGYTTKWGDNAADFYPILHLYKTEVWELARALGVSQAIIDKPPSAGLWEGQTDEGEIGMSYARMDEGIYHLLNDETPVRLTPEMKTLKERHTRNLHKINPGRNLICCP